MFEFSLWMGDIESSYTKNMLMKALGCNAFVEPDVMIKGFQKDDIYLMVTDGLTNLVSKDHIFETVKKENLEQVPKKLVEQAIENGTCTSEIKSTILRKELIDKEKQSYATAKLYKNNVFWFCENKAITVYPLSQKYHGKV